MKKFAAGLLTVFCATAFSVAQQNESNEWPQAPSYIDSINPQNVHEVFQEAQPEAQNAVQSEVSNNATTTIAPANNATNSSVTSNTSAIDSTNNSTNANTAMPIDEQPVVFAPKKSSVGIGARAAFIYGNFWGFKDLKSDGMEPPTGFGGEFGIAARFGMVDGLQFSPEILFRFFNLSHDEDEVERGYDQYFLDFAFFIRGIFGGGFFLEVAPQISINLSSEYTFDGHKNTFEHIQQAAAEFGLNFGAGYYILDNLSLNFRWYMGFTEVFPDVKYEGEMNSIKEEKNKSNSYWSTINLKGAHTMMFKFGINYWFI